MLSNLHSNRLDPLAGIPSPHEPPRPPRLHPQPPTPRPPLASKPPSRYASVRHVRREHPAVILSRRVKARVAPRRGLAKCPEKIHFSPTQLATHIRKPFSLT